MGSGSYLKRFGKRLAKRDGGWLCHYCHIPLVPVGTSYEHPDYHDPWDAEKFDGTKYIEWNLKPGYQYACVDHKLPRSAGRGDELENLLLACILCNHRRGAMSYEDYLDIRRQAVKQ